MNKKSALSRARIFVCDAQSIYYGVYPHLVKYGLIWCDPSDVRLTTRYFNDKIGGYLIGGGERDRSEFGGNVNLFISAGDWDLEVSPIEDLDIYNRIFRRFLHDETWEQTGEVDWMMRNIAAAGAQDGCRCLKDVMARCDRFDAIKHAAEKEGRLKTRAEINPGAFREKGGIGVAIGRDGDLVWMGNGGHRLAISRLVGLEKIPACVLMVHKQAVHSGVAFKNIRLASHLGG